MVPPPKCLDSGDLIGGVIDAILAPNFVDIWAQVNPHLRRVFLKKPGQFFYML